MGFIESFVRRPVTVAVGVVLVALFGTIALFRMPMQLTPEVERPVIEVETRWRGASPQEIEREIVQPQEEQLQAVEGVVKLSSQSKDSRGQITLEFPVGADMRKALTLVNVRLQQVRQYPIDADEPIISLSSQSNRHIAWFILNVRAPKEEEYAAFVEQHPNLSDVVASARRAHSTALMLRRLREAAAEYPEVNELLPKEQDLTTLRRFAEDYIEARFERVEGVSQSNVMGGREDEVQVVVDPHRLAARRLTIGDVRDALASNDKDISGGDFWEGKRRYVVRTTGQYRSLKDVESVVVASRDGRPVYVRDVAEVRFGYKKPDGIVRRYGSNVIAINAQRETGANVLDIMAGLQAACDELNSSLLWPRGLEITQVYDETDYIYSSIAQVNDNIVEASVLTFIVLMLFLRSVRSSVIIFLSIAVSVIGMFLLLGLMGRTLNVLSLAGIAFAVGMLVDNFIVVLENIFRHYQSGDRPLQATVRGTKEVWGAVFTATLANLAVFIPVLFVADEAGQLFQDIALAISAALILSLFVALVVVPTAASRILKHLPHHEEGHVGEAAPSKSTPHPAPAAGSDTAWARFRRMLGVWGQALNAVLERFIWGPSETFGRAFVDAVVRINAWLQRSVMLQLIAVAVFVVGAWMLAMALAPKVEYLPNGNRNLVIGLLLPPPGYNVEKLNELGTQIEAALRPYWDVDPSMISADSTAPVIGDFFYVARERELFLGIRSYDPLRAAELEAVVRSVADKAPGTIVVAKQSSLFESGLGAGRTIDIEITGPDIVKLSQLGGRVMGAVMNPENPVIPNAQARPVPSLDLSSPEVHVAPRREQAAELGLSADELGYTVDALVDGAYATDYFVGGDRIDLRIVGEEALASSTEDVGRLNISTPAGKVVSLEAVADVRDSSGPEQINHRERQRAVTIEVTPPADMALEDAMDRITSQIIAPMQQDGSLEGGLYQINLAGTADKLRATWSSLRWNLLLAVVITYLVMAALFESWLYPFVIMLSVPLGAVGGFAGLWLMNLFVLQPLDVMTMLGFIILVGTVVNNPILIVEQALQLIREEGLTYRNAILESVRTRIRPIFMTAFVGLFGLLPLVVSPGAGSELYRGLGAVLLGGLLVSTMFTLILVPTLFALTLEARDALARIGWCRPAMEAGEQFRDETESAAPAQDVRRPELTPAPVLRAAPINGDEDDPNPAEPLNRPLQPR